jgi:hypothetical protein
MDERRFDRWTRLLATGATRRATLAVALPSAFTWRASKAAARKKHKRRFKKDGGVCGLGLGPCCPGFVCNGLTCECATAPCGSRCCPPDTACDGTSCRPQPGGANGCQFGCGGNALCKACAQEGRTYGEYGAGPDHLACCQCTLGFCSGTNDQCHAAGGVSGSCQPR